MHEKLENDTGYLFSEEIRELSKNKDRSSFYNLPSKISFHNFKDFCPIRWIVEILKDEKPKTKMLSFFYKQQSYSSYIDKANFTNHFL